jgi:hypothetical protein
MVPDKDTAEERLLRLIENPSVAHAAAGGPSLQKTKDKWRGFLAGMNRRQPSFRRRPSEDEFLEKIRFGSKLLWIVLVLLALYVAKDMVTPYRRPAGARSAASRSGKPLPGSDSLSAKPDDYLKPLSVYISAADSRNPFRSGDSGPAEPVQTKTAPNQLETLSQGLTVVGIDRSGTPRALIEDAKGNKTYFVGVGESIGSMKVKKITEKGVVLTQDGKEIELNY